MHDWEMMQSSLLLQIGWWHALLHGACRVDLGTNQEGILVEIKGSKLRTPKIMVLVVDTHVEVKFV